MPMPTLRLHQLEGFFLVARHGSYTKAALAYAYPIGQPAVYQQVKGLQEDLGITLVRQSGPRRTELTPEGRALYAFLTPFFEGLPKLVARLKGAVAEPLIVAADQLLAMEAVPGPLLDARKACPGFLLRLEELPTLEIVRRVTEGSADAGLLHLPKVPHGLVWHPLGRIGIALLVPADHLLAKLGRPPTPREISAHPLLVYEPRSPGRALTERLFRERGMPLLVAAEVSFAQTMHAMVRAGVAPAFVPYLLPGRRGAPEPAGMPRVGRTVAFEMSGPLKAGALPFGLLYRPGTEESLTFQALVKALQEWWG